MAGRLRRQVMEGRQDPRARQRWQMPGATALAPQRTLTSTKSLRRGEGMHRSHGLCLPSLRHGGFYGDLVFYLHCSAPNPGPRRSQAQRAGAAGVGCPQWGGPPLHTSGNFQPVCSASCLPLQVSSQANFQAGKKEYSPGRSHAWGKGDTAT